jgi:hypothetical protein
MMTAKPDQVAAVRFAVERTVNGSSAIVMEHVNRLTVAAAPEWPIRSQSIRHWSENPTGGPTPRSHFKREGISNKSLQLRRFGQSAVVDSRLLGRSELRRCRRAVMVGVG